jgi:hypothetical protein
MDHSSTPARMPWREFAAVMPTRWKALRRWAVGHRGPVAGSPAALGLASQEPWEADFSRSIRTAGRIAVDERRVQRVFSKSEGHVERLVRGLRGPAREEGELRSSSAARSAAAERGGLRQSARRRDGAAGGWAAQGEELRPRAVGCSPGVPDHELERSRREASLPSRRSTRRSGIVTQKLVAPVWRDLGPLYELADLAHVAPGRWLAGPGRGAGGSPAAARAAAVPGHDEGHRHPGHPAVDPPRGRSRCLEVDNGARALARCQEVTLDVGRGRAGGARERRPRQR